MNLHNIIGMDSHRRLNMNRVQIVSELKLSKMEKGPVD